MANGEKVGIEQLKEINADLLSVVRIVANMYETEQTQGQFPNGVTFGCIHHSLGQAARSAIRKATGRA